MLEGFTASSVFCPAACRRDPLSAAANCAKNEACQGRTACHARPSHHAVSDKIFAELRKIDTPTITNVVATYPKNPLCLGLYNPWTENWYTDTSIRCIYPEMGPVVGYAVTCVYGMPDPNYTGRLTFLDVVDALDAMPKPTILVIQQKWPDEISTRPAWPARSWQPRRWPLAASACFQRPVARHRRHPQVKFQLLLGGVTTGHGEMGVQAVHVPVSVGGMDVAPGELIHMDENGAVKFPRAEARRS